MKKLMYIMAALGIVSLSACNNDGDIPDEPYKSFISQDGEQDFLNNFFWTDDDGNVEQYIMGIPLDNSKKDVVSFAMDNLTEARDQFLAYIPEDGKVEHKPDGSIVYTPVKVETFYKWSGDSTDEPILVHNVSTDEPTITFKPVEEGNLMATITFASSQSAVKRAEILYNWTRNSDSPFLEGEVVHDLRFHCCDNMVCIREAKNGIAGVFLYISPKRMQTTSIFRDWPHPGMLCSRDVKYMPEFKQAADYFKIFRRDMTRWQVNFREAGLGEPQYGEQYWYGERVLWDWATFCMKENGDCVRECFSRQKSWEKRCLMHEFFNM